jgi:DNA polymerase IV
VTVRCILHADMDAFFASIEIRDQPSLAAKPVVVGGSSNRGVVSAASYEARRFGIHSAMPIYRARELCPTAIFLPVDMPRYVRESQAILAIFEDFTPLVEPLSLDEAFLDITGSLGLYGPPRALGEELKRRVHEATGLRVSVGIGPNKLVAKIAGKVGKPDGLVVVEPGEVEGFLSPMRVGQLWGVGPVAQQALLSAGIETVKQLAEADAARLAPVFAGRASEYLALARGQDDRPVSSDRQPRSYGEECTFEEDTRDGGVIRATLYAHAEAVGRRLRRDGREGQTVVLKVKLGRAEGHTLGRSGSPSGAPCHPLLTRSVTLAESTADGPSIGQAAVRLWEELGLGEVVRLVGVTVRALRPASAEQLSLFDGGGDRKRRLGRTLVEIESRFGRGAVVRGAGPRDKLTPSMTRKRGD